MYSNASIKNILNGYGQGYIAYLRDQHSNSAITLSYLLEIHKAAETFAFTEGTDAAYFISQLDEESKLLSPSTQTHTYTDNKCLYDSANTTSQIADKRLRVEMSTIREMKDKGEVIMHWIDKENPIADCLTKKGTKCNNLLTTFKHGKLF